MTNAQYHQVKEAVALLKRHCEVDYNNSLQVSLAQRWFEESLDCAAQGRFSPLPKRPALLRDSPD